MDAMTTKTTESRDATTILSEWFPLAFFVFEQRRKPLKVGIYDDILQATARAIRQRKSPAP